MNRQTFKHIRKKLDMTQRDLGEWLGVATCSVYRLERGTRPVRDVYALAMYGLAVANDCGRLDALLGMVQADDIGDAGDATSQG